MTARTWSMVLVAGLVACDAGELQGTDGELVGTTGGAESSTGETTGEPASTGDTTGAPASAAPLELTRDAAITYVLAWSWEGARREGDAWVFETDLGYTVGISAAHSATSQLELVPCSTASQASGGGAIAWLSDLVVGTAHAAHGGTPDASAAAFPIVESWLTERPLVFGAAKASGAAYCEAHQLSAPIEAAAPDGFAFAGESLVVSGFWSAPGEAERHGLEVSVNLSDGRVRPLAAVIDWPAEAIEGEAAIVITRRPARAFDGLKIDEMAEIDLAFEALGGLLHSADVAVAVRP
jgi:hypothetical protein